jgi:Na+-driven multidrug efflux pump
VHGCNIVFSVLFVYGFGWGIAGVAWGTVLAQGIACIPGLVLVLRHTGGFARLRAALPSAVFLDAGAVTRLIALSRDLIIRSLALEGAYVIFVALLARESAASLSANALLLNLSLMMAYFLDGQAQAAEQLCGKAVGANYRPAFDRALRLTLGWGLAIGAGLLALLLVGGPAAIDFMTTTPEVRVAAHAHLFIAALIALTGVHAFVMDGVIIGATLNRVIRNGILFAFVAFLVAAFLLHPHFGVNGLWLAMHVFFLSRGAYYWLAVRRNRPVLFPET